MLQYTSLYKVTFAQSVTIDIFRILFIKTHVYISTIYIFIQQYNLFAFGVNVKEKNRTFFHQYISFFFLNIKKEK